VPPPPPVHMGLKVIFILVVFPLGGATRPRSANGTLDCRTPPPSVPFENRSLLPFLCLVLSVQNFFLGYRHLKDLCSLPSLQKHDSSFPGNHVWCHSRVRAPRSRPISSPSLGLLSLFSEEYITFTLRVFLSSRHFSSSHRGVFVIQPPPPPTVCLL